MPPPDKRAAVLDAALKLFGELGFHGAAVPLIAERAKVATGTIYRYFPSKEVLVNELYRGLKKQLGDTILTNFPVDAPARKQFHHFWEAASSFAVFEPAAFMFLEAHHHAPYLDDASRAVEDAVLAPAISFVTAAIEAQVVKPLDPWLLMSIVWGSWSPW